MSNYKNYRILKVFFFNLSCSFLLCCSIIIRADNIGKESYSHLEVFGYDNNKQVKIRNPYKGCDREATETPNESYPFKSKYVDIDGYKIHYVEEGEGRPILFIHGNPTWSYIWRNIFPCVARNSNRRAIAIDLLGLGKSDKPDIDYTPQRHAEILTKFIEKLELNDLVLVGQDWGGALMTHYAVHNPETVEGLVLLETFAWTLEYFGEFASLIQFIRSEQGQSVLINDKNWFVDNFIQRAVLNQENFTEKVYRKYLKRLKVPEERAAMATFPILLPFVDDPITPQASFDFFDEIQYKRNNLYNKQLLVLRASPGLLISDETWSRVLDFTSVLPNTEIRDVGTGLHVVQEDNPDNIVYAISQWLWEKRLAGKKYWWDSMGSN